MERKREPAFAGEIPVTGRLEPRPQPLPKGFKHVVTYHRSGTGISARCSCEWRVWLDNGHTLADFAELERQHSGVLAGAGS
jgi:hypothetical protein